MRSAFSASYAVDRYRPGLVTVIYERSRRERPDRPEVGMVGSGLSMAKRPRIVGLDDFGLTPARLSRLGPRLVRVSIDLRGKPVTSLWPLPPRQRDVALRETLAKQLERLRRAFPEIEFVSRGKDKPSWTIDATVPADQVAELASSRPVKCLVLETIEGRRKRVRRPGLSWFCVWGVVAIQIEERVNGSLTVEDRLALVKAHDCEDAKGRLQHMWSSYAEPYMNPDGYLVRWQLIDIRDIYELSDRATSGATHHERSSPTTRILRTRHVISGVC